eukprot:Lithocolla_globosa_v1_NODE_773_length_3298_cov_177.812828.p2 type:complete len:111 gc:universal NODE_773_length_3298_cov_177.812828:304-636(+)
MQKPIYIYISIFLSPPLYPHKQCESVYLNGDFISLIEWSNLSSLLGGGRRKKKKRRRGRKNKQNLTFQLSPAKYQRWRSSSHFGSLIISHLNVERGVIKATNNSKNFIFC